MNDDDSGEISEASQAQAKVVLVQLAGEQSGRLANMFNLLEAYLKGQEKLVKEVVAQYMETPPEAESPPEVVLDYFDAQPQRWAAIAQTHFQEGLMALYRAINQPTNF